MKKPDEDNGYPRVLDAEGCLYGQHLKEAVDKMDEKQEKVQDQLRKQTIALVGVALSFTVSGILLALNLVLKLI